MSTPIQAPRRCAQAICTAMALAGVVSSIPSARAQGSPIPAEVTAVLARAGGSSSDDISTLQAGRVLVRTEVVPEHLESSVVAAVRINTAMERTVTYFRQLLAYVDGQTTLQYSPVTQPAEASDFRTAVLDAADVADLRACQPAACDIRVGNATIDDVRSAPGAITADAGEGVNGWMRRTLASSVNSYQRAGDAALRIYDERGAAVDAAALWQALEERSPIPATLAAGLRRYLASYPGARPAEATDEMYWDRQRLTGLKPVIGVTHLVTWRDAAQPQRTIIVQKQIAASHYFFGSLAVTLFVQDSATPPATYVVFTNGTRGDLLRGTQTSAQTGLRGRITGISAGAQRRLVEQLVRQSAERLMGAMKEALER